MIITIKKYYYQQEYDSIYIKKVARSTRIVGKRPWIYNYKVNSRQIESGYICKSIRNNKTKFINLVIISALIVINVQLL